MEVWNALLLILVQALTRLLRDVPLALGPEVSDSGAVGSALCARC